MGRLGSTDLVPVALLQNRRLARGIASSPFRGKLSSMGRDSRKGPFLLLLLPICDDPGSGHRAGRAHPPAHHLGRPRQRDRAACRGCRLLVVLSPDGTLGNAMGLRSRMLVVRRQEQ